MYGPARKFQGVGILFSGMGTPCARAGPAHSISRPCRVRIPGRWRGCRMRADATQRRGGGRIASTLRHSRAPQRQRIAEAEAAAVTAAQQPDLSTAGERQCEEHRMLERDLRFVGDAAVGLERIAEQFAARHRWQPPDRIRQRRRRQHTKHRQHRGESRAVLLQVSALSGRSSRPAAVTCRGAGDRACRLPRAHRSGRACGSGRR